MTIAEDMGRIFEVGFNIGILTYIDQTPEFFQTHYGDAYRRDLQQVRFGAMSNAILRKLHIVSPTDQQIIEKWLAFYCEKGFLAGHTFFREYIAATGWQTQRQPIEIVYYQCSFSDENSAGTRIKGAYSAAEDLLAQLGDRLKREAFEISTFQHKGEFLQADTLMLLRHRSNHRLLCVDLSVFAIRALEDVQDLDNSEVLRHLLIQEVSYMRAKSVFAGLSIDTAPLNLPFSENLTRYFRAFSRGDKESAKLIQAGSYTESFWRFLRAHTTLEIDESRVLLNIVGYTDRNIGAITLRPDDASMLQACATIYKQSKKESDLHDARTRVFEVIGRNAAQGFEQGKSFIAQLNGLTEASPGIHRVCHQELITGFANTTDTVGQWLPPEDLALLGLGSSAQLSLRDAHARLVNEALGGDATYLFLTGNPGIGKTTALSDFLKAHIDEGFLFLYASPRKQVNLDILAKLTHNDTLFDDRVIAINTNADIIRERLRGQRFGAARVVQYRANIPLSTETLRGVQFVNAADSLRNHRDRPEKGRLTRKTDEIIGDAGESVGGVLASTCGAIDALITESISNAIVATVTVQALKKTAGGDTLRHLDTIFRSATNTTVGPIPAKMRAIAGRIRHIFVMIDEVTGDESGVEFLEGVRRWVEESGLTDPQYGFNTKIIVADASIVDTAVIREHLEQTVVEPDKIYFRIAPPEHTTAARVLWQDTFSFHGRTALTINTNSYPADRLYLNYQVFLESLAFDSAFAFGKDVLADYIKSHIVDDVLTLLEQNKDEQIIVYIQDKRHLSDVIGQIRERVGTFIRYEHYIDIHANLSQEDKEAISIYKDQVKVVFMTASASRGLSFARVRHILVAVPRFAVEQNLMEIIQVIYRGRGLLEWERGDKYVTFYLADRAVYSDEADRVYKHQESVMTLVNMLLILKASVMTRIRGYGRIGWGRDVLLVPIGGKAVHTADSTFTGTMNSLIGELNKERVRRPEDADLSELSRRLARLFGQVTITLADTQLPMALKVPQSESYLALRETFHPRFVKAANSGLDRLLTAFGSLPPAYIVGSMLIVRCDSKIMRENYLMRIGQELNVIDAQMQDIVTRILRQRRRYPEGLLSQLQAAADLVHTLRSDAISRSQLFEQQSRNDDQYYAIPLHAFLCGDTFKAYFENNVQEPDRQAFRTILERHVRSVYPVENVLPIGAHYDDSPYIVFRSFSLAEFRRKMFTRNHLMTSNELNVLSLLLATDG